MITHFQSKLVEGLSKNAPVYLVTAQTKGKPSWYYVQVDELKHNAFKKQAAQGPLDLAAFGTVLESGWGEYPPDPIIALMQEKFAA